MKTFGQTPASAAFEERAIKTMMLGHLRPAEMQAIAAEAQKFYASCVSGSARKRVAERVDKDIKRPKKNEDPKTSEAAFKRARRDSLTSAMENWDPALAWNLDEEPFDNGMLGDGFEGEYSFQKAKQVNNLVDAYRDGLIPESQVDKEALEKVLSKEADQDKLLIREGKMQKSFAKKMHGLMNWDDLAGKKAWVSSDAQTEAIDIGLQQFNLVKTHDRMDAHVLVVKDASAMPERARLCAGALGLIVMDACLFEGQQGFKVKFKSACQTPRKIFFTAAVKRKHAEFEKNVGFFLDKPTKISKWKLVRVKKDANMILGIADECQGQPSHFSKASFLEKISRMDLHASGVYKAA